MEKQFDVVMYGNGRRTSYGDHVVFTGTQDECALYAAEHYGNWDDACYIDEHIPEEQFFYQRAA